MKQAFVPKSTVEDVMLEIAREIGRGKEPDEFTVDEFVSVLSAQGIQMTRRKAELELSKRVESGLLAARKATIGGHRCKVFRKSNQKGIDKRVG